MTGITEELVRDSVNMQKMTESLLIVDIFQARALEVCL